MIHQTVPLHPILSILSSPSSFSYSLFHYLLIMSNTKGTVHEQFVGEPKTLGQKLTRVKCKHCGHSLVKQVNQMTGHLEKCHQYQQSLVKKKPTDITASVHKCGPIEQQRLDGLAGMAIFAGGLPFSTFDKGSKSDMWNFIHALNLAYKIPERHRIAKDLLLQCYEHIKIEVDKLLEDV